MRLAVSEVASSRVRNHGGFYRGLEQSPRVSNRWKSSGGVETNELPLAPRDATQTRVSALRGRAHGNNFADFNAGCHGPVPLESVISSEDAATHSAISPVHHMGCAITEAGSCA